MFWIGGPDNQECKRNNVDEGETTDSPLKNVGELGRGKYFGCGIKGRKRSNSLNVGKRQAPTVTRTFFLGEENYKYKEFTRVRECLKEVMGRYNQVKGLQTR